MCVCLHVCVCVCVCVCVRERERERGMAGGRDRQDNRGRLTTEEFSLQASGPTADRSTW